MYINLGSYDIPLKNLSLVDLILIERFYWVLDLHTQEYPIFDYTLNL